MKTKVVLRVAGLIVILALISAGYCFWLMTVPLSYDWIPVVIIGFVVAIGVLVISLITSFIALIRLRRSPRAPDASQIRPTSNQPAQPPMIYGEGIRQSE
jgi:cytochrome c biogenesis protein CcdA